MHEPRSRWRFLMPAPLDAWVLATVLFWTAAIFASLFWHMSFRRHDSIDLSMPVAVGTLAILLGVSTAATFRTTSWRLWLLFLLTIAGGILPFLFIGSWLEMKQPAFVTQSYGQSESRTAMEYAQSYWPITAIGLGAWVAIYLATKLSHRNPAGGSWFIKACSFLNRHRSRLMIGFVAVMLPAMVIRNLFDPNNQSADFSFGAMILAIVFLALLFSSHFLVRLSFSLRWPRLKILGAIFISLAGGLVFGAGVWDGSTSLVGQGCATAIAPVLFVLAIVAALSVQAVRKELEGRRYFSIWSPLLAVPVLLFFGISLTRYDVRVGALAFMEDKDFFSSFKWIELARQSREFQRATDGAVRFVNGYGSTALQVNIRGQRDADALQKLFDYNPNFSAWLLIENLQPYVDTKPLATHNASLSLIRGRCSSQQLNDISSGATSLFIDRVRLPDRNEHETTSVPPVIFSHRDTPGLAAFLDSYAPTSLSNITLQYSLSGETIDAIIRHNQTCPFTIYVDLNTKPELLEAFEAAKQRPLSGITLGGTYDLDSKRLLRLFVESDLKPLQLPTDQEQLFWDYIFVKPHVALSPANWDIDQSMTFKDQAKKFHWAYEWNNQGDITKTWLPGLQEISDHAADLANVQTLRLDHDGICGQADFVQTNEAPLAKMINLRRLYLPRGFFVNDLGFLRSLPKLQHLQIQSQDRNMLWTRSGMDVCKNLESLRVFGVPDPATIKELAKLQKLLRLEIIDDDGVFDDDVKPEQLKSQLPSVDVQIIAAEDCQPDFSDDLEQHLRRARQEARERLMSATELVAE